MARKDGASVAPDAPRSGAELVCTMDAELHTTYFEAGTGAIRRLIPGERVPVEHVEDRSIESIVSQGLGRVEGGRRAPAEGE